MNEQQQRDLMAGLKALADATRHASASPGVEEAVLARMAVASEPHSPGFDAPRPPTFAGFAALAAGIVVMVAGAMWIASSGRHDVEIPRPPLAGFVEVPYASALPQMESASIVEVMLPVSALPTYGVAIVPEMSGVVQAELLVAQDGHPRAIRLVNHSATTGSTP